MTESSRTELPARRIRWSGLSDRGRFRANNEDSFLGLQFNATETHHLGKIGETSLDASDLVFAVSDGMGGARAGEFASRISVDKIIRLLPPAFKQSALGLATGFDDVLSELFDEIHKALTYLAWGDPDCAGMGCTLSLCWFTPEQMYFAHIGDSRIYYLPAREGGIRQISHDDTYVGWLFRQGKINMWEARNHPGRNSLQKALGAGHQFVTPQLGTIICEPGDLFLLCSDGLVDGLLDSQMLDQLRGSTLSQNRAAELVKTAVQQSGRDNTTALVIEIE